MGKWLVILFCSISFASFAQILEGTVYNENKKPLAGVTVYLDGTTFSASTDSNGKYSIITNGKINTILVVRYMGYETFFVAHPFENNNLEISLSIKIETLKEVVITKDLFSRKDKLKIFRECFLGLTEAGRSCEIVNEGDIEFEYDYAKNVLTASCEVPIFIKNKYLGYDVQFTLNEFNLKFNKKSIQNSDVIKSLYFGTAFFNDVVNDEKIKARRNKTYLGSSIHFFKNLIDSVWDKDNFLVFKRSFQVDPKKFFKVEDLGDIKKVSILKNDLADIKIEGQNPKFYADINVLYKKKHQSRIVFKTATFYLDNFGNNSNIQDIEYSGVLSTKKMGDMLPLNFEVEAVIK